MSLGVRHRRRHLFLDFFVVLYHFVDGSAEEALRCLRTFGMSGMRMQSLVRSLILFARDDCDETTKHRHPRDKRSYEQHKKKTRNKNRKHTKDQRCIPKKRKKTNREHPRDQHSHWQHEECRNHRDRARPSSCTGLGGSKIHSHHRKRKLYFCKHIFV